jgi:ATP/maltotriose-dependent transcriptional regulator MalT
VVLHEEGSLNEAERFLSEARDLYDSLPGPQHFRRAFPRLTLAAVFLDQGAFVEAETAAREAEAILSSTLSQPSYVTATARCRMGRALAGQGRDGDARPLLEGAVETLSRTAQPSVRYRVECRSALARLYRRLGRKDLAADQERELRKIRERRDGDVTIGQS